VGGDKIFQTDKKIVSRKSVGRKKKGNQILDRQADWHQTDGQEII
jgi:hypothetical protein